MHRVRKVEPSICETCYTRNDFAVALYIISRFLELPLITLITKGLIRVGN